MGSLGSIEIAESRFPAKAVSLVRVETAEVGTVVVAAVVPALVAFVAVAVVAVPAETVAVVVVFVGVAAVVGAMSVGAVAVVVVSVGVVAVVGDAVRPAEFPLADVGGSSAGSFDRPASSVAPVCSRLRRRPRTSLCSFELPTGSYPHSFVG